MTRLLPIFAIAVAAAVLGGCGGNDDADVCANDDGALTGTAFVIVKSPHAGERVSSGFRVSGCSQTFEANVVWRLRARDGSTLVSGFTQGGGTAPGPFEFTVTYSIPARQIGRLEVDEPSITSEGPPPMRNIIPLVLAA